MAPLPRSVHPGGEQPVLSKVVRRVVVRHYPAPVFAQFLVLMHEQRMTGTVNVRFNFSQGTVTSFDAEEPEA